MSDYPRIAVCTAQIPFEYGGAEILADALIGELKKRGYPVETVRVPFRWYPKEEVLKGYLSWRLLDLTESEGKPIDIVIALKFPSFVVRHPRKVVWLIQQFRQVYELFGTPHSHFRDAPYDHRLREIIRCADTQSLAEAHGLFAISRNVAERLARFNGLRAHVLPCPPKLDGLYRCDDYQDYILVVSRLVEWKRNHLIVEAMAYTRTPARLLIAGRGPELQRLQDLARGRGIADRVEFLGFVPDEQLLDLYANCFAVFYGPMDEDYGLATIEAFKSRKPVLTFNDSGGVLEYVEHGVTGYVASVDDLRQLAERIDQLYADRELCRRMGTAGYERVQPITWDVTIAHLLEG